MSWKKIDDAALRLSTRHALAINKALVKTIDPAQVADAFLSVFPNGGTMTPDEARAWAKAHIIIDDRPLAAPIRKMYAEAYQLGLDTSNYAYGKAVMKKDAVQDAINAALAIDWSKWTPGNSGSALLMNPPDGLRKLLDQTNATIQGMGKTTLERLGTVLHTALASGAAMETVARDILAAKLRLSVEQGARKVLTDPARALMIARTEINRAQSVASNDNYKNLGVQQVRWRALEECDICAQNANQIVPQGQAFPSGHEQPPAHPNCRCGILPVIAGLYDEPLTPEQIEAPVKIKIPPLPTENQAIDIMNEQAIELNAYELSQIESEALARYRGFGYEDVNGVLRNLAQATEEGVNIERAQRWIAAIDDVMRRAPKTLSSFSVERTVGDAFAEMIRSLAPGDQFTDAGFVSTTVNPKWYKKYASAIKNPQKLQIIVDEGQSGIWIEKLMTGQSTPNLEAEFLLPRGTTFEVVKVEGDTTIVRIV